MEPRFNRGPSLADDVETIALYAIWLAPAIAAVALGLLLSIEWLIVVGIVILIVPPAIRLLFDGWW